MYQENQEFEVIVSYIGGFKDSLGYRRSCLKKGKERAKDGRDVYDLNRQEGFRPPWNI